ncbi:slr2077 [Synechocystis sp. PCC 6803]|uniref:Slr2077 protein n=1 Tax=Synechocystis sp. (strain ATCC 27184 / PCC 6803 / Kazusa) TaxID=1111708 RepID=P73380_SYNY3|nr:MULTISPECIES: EAL domain-containing protein [unclassified Synechocystis]AGF51101.1 hypothetical protein MYO_18430 [Synechocystis sp. PCC 6803]ALJ67132.1 hypothetical protein AOY38_04305 [Synechocystis sp. PCC 6803]AVP88973.1 hypothetical protein C7I86_04310 [Synechocystis sp. IPPAS B-1465]MBD2618641.1 EAL domain-containing protein [Synechocystis sp. FACHB-898]MBD2639992.1 EAL domain-containing protein [Synechocystis sp. FACHB-908]
MNGIHRWLFRLSIIIQLLWGSAPVTGTQVVRIGVYENQPKIFLNDQNRPVGFWIDVIEAIAAAENWQIEYHLCEWQACLQKLEAGKIDLMPDVAVNPERAKKFQFNQEVVLNSWSIIYAANNANINSIIDLEGKRIVVLKNSVQEKNLIKRLAELKIKAEIIQVDSFSELFKKIDAGEADAGAVNYFFGNRFSHQHRVRPTNMVVDTSQLFFAASRQTNPAILRNIDEQVNLLKADTDSIYYESQKRWLFNNPLLTIQNLRAIIHRLIIIFIIVTVAIVIIWNYRLQKEIKLRKASQNQLSYQALHDTLTGLANRALLLQRLEFAGHQIKNNPKSRFALLFIDLDHFKLINDSWGHSVGDALLIKIAEKLQINLRETDLAVRLGGDEFVIFLESITEIKQAIDVAERILIHLRLPVQIQAKELFVKASIGIVIGSIHYYEPERLIRDADIAMYQAKNNGRNQYAVFDPSMHQTILERLSLEHDFRKALEQETLELYYQPIISLVNDRLQGFEALIRWQHPEKGYINPEQLIAIAEETGLIIILGQWIMQQACQQIAQWREITNDDKIYVSINLSPNQICRPLFVEEIENILQTTKLDGDALVLEITEGVLIQHLEIVAECLKKIKSHGIKISIDDFGTGYSSLSYLYRLPVNYLKIDRSFINQITEDSPSQSIVKTIITLGDLLDIQTVAEGVETNDQLNLLKKMGCGLGQGYFWSEPMTVREIDCFLDCIV